MKTNINNLLILFILSVSLLLGCGSYKGIGDSDSRKVERGRLKFQKFVTNLVIGSEPIYRNVEQYLFVDGKKWSPDGEPKFADKLNWCDSSPNPKIEILRCFGDSSENYKTTYIVRMKNDKPEIQKIDEGLPSTWANDDGRWLLFSRFRLNVETGEKVEMKVIPLAGQTAEILPLFVIGVSPDMKTIVELPDNIGKTEGAEEFLTLWIIDTETGKLEARKASLTKNPWLTDHDNGKVEDDFMPPPAPSKHFVWEKDANGKDKLILPQLPEKVEKK